MRLWKTSFLVAAAVIVSAGLALADTVSVNVNVGVCVTNQGDNGRIDWTKGVVYVKGEGVPKQSITHKGQRKLTAKSAARDVAMKNWATMIAGVAVDNQTQTVDSASNLDVINTSLKAFVKGGKIYDQNSPMMEALGFTGLGWNAEDEIYTIVLGVPLNGPQGVAQAVLPVVTAPNYAPAKPSDPPQYQDIPSPDSRSIPEGGPTGLIIDCTTADIEPAMSPKVYNADTKQEIYGTANIDTDTAVRKGIVGYVTSLDAARQAKDRVGANPMVIPASQAVGKHGVAVSADDANKIASANEKGKFLKDCKVMFVIKQK